MKLTDDHLQTFVEQGFVAVEISIQNNAGPRSPRPSAGPSSLGKHSPPIRPQSDF